jgi:hypothetical protein
VVGNGIQVFLVENDIFKWAYLQATCLHDKGRDRQNKDGEARIHGGRRY